MPVEPQNEEVTVENLQQELQVMFGDNESMMDEWIDSSIPILEGERPRDLFDSPERRQRLFQVLQEMKFGEMA